MSKKTKKQVKDNERIAAWRGQVPYEENAKATPEVPQLVVEDVLRDYTPDHITSMGKYYTPIGMAVDLISYTPINRASTVFEPCAGIGHLVYEVIEMGVDPGNITAYEIDPVDQELGGRLFPQVQWWNANPFDHYQDLTGLFDLVVMNPPYNIRTNREAGHEMTRKKCTKSEHLFLELAIRAVKPHGMIACIAPANFIDRIPKKLKDWFNQYVADATDFGPLNGNFATTGIRVNGWLIQRNGEEILDQGTLPKPEVLVERISENQEALTEKIGDLKDKIKPPRTPSKAKKKASPSKDTKPTVSAPQETQPTLDSLLASEKEIEYIFEGGLLIREIEENFHDLMVFTRQPDKDFVESIRRLGVLQPILIASVDDKYIIKAGKRRFLSAKEVGHAAIPVRVYLGDGATDALVGIDSNLRRSPNPVDDYNNLLQLEEAAAKRKIVYSDKQLANFVGVNIKTLRKMRSVSTMPPAVQDGINERRIVIEQAYILAKLPPSKQKPHIKKLAEGGKVTGREIKESKQVVREAQTQKAIPLLTIPETERPDIPTVEVLADALNRLTGGELKGGNLLEVAEFCKRLIVNPTQELTEVFSKTDPVDPNRKASCSCGETPCTCPF